MFWRVPVYWSADALRFSWLARGVKLAIRLERAMIFFINLVFIIASSYFALIEFISAIRHKPYPLSIRHTHPSLYTILLMLMGNIWIASILQTLLDHGDNPRFLVPLQSLVVLWVAVFILQLVSHKQAVSTPTLQP
jgi:SNF family Na+-dependent transporter